jgi:hypothetical protein
MASRDFCAKTDENWVVKKHFTHPAWFSLWAGPDYCGQAPTISKLLHEGKIQKDK